MHLDDREEPTAQAAAVAAADVGVCDRYRRIVEVSVLDIKDQLDRQAGRCYYDR